MHECAAIYMSTLLFLALLVSRNDGCAINLRALQHCIRSYENGCHDYATYTAWQTFARFT